jgi:hypothetical protein
MEKDKNERIKVFFPYNPAYITKIKGRKVFYSIPIIENNEKNK